MIPGQVIVQAGNIELNKNRKTIQITVANHSDRPIQIGSHYHFFEVNQALKFERAQSYGYRLDIVAGTVVLVELAGKRQVYGFQGAVMGALDDKGIENE